MHTRMTRKSRKSLVGLLLPALVSVAVGSERATTNWMAVLLKNQKIGYLEEVRAFRDDRILTRETIHVETLRGSTRVVMDFILETEEKTNGVPLGFTLIARESSGVSNRIEGLVTAGGELHARIVTAGQERTARTEWPRGALLREGIRQRLLTLGLREGAVHSVTLFSPDMLRAIPCRVRVGPRTQVDLLGRVVPLTEVEEEMETPSGTIRLRVWCDTALEVHRMITSLLGMELEMVSCPRAFALSPNTSVNLLESTLLSSPRRLSPSERAGVVRYALEFRPDAPAGNIPETDEQRHLPSPPGQTNRVILEVCPLTPARGLRFPAPETASAPPASLRASRYIESDASELIALARNATDGIHDAAEAAACLEAFVRRHIRIKSLSVGFASALEAARSREGDCSEHALLTAALCRAVGLPARIVFGLAYADAGRFTARKQVFIPHAWTQVFLGGKWISLDAALEGFDAGHIALAIGNGEPEEFFGILHTLGWFQIVSIFPQRASPRPLAQPESAPNR